MVKRKRDEPRLEVNLQKWEKELVRGLKLAKGFERQRYAKRQRDADADKSARLEKEIAVLKGVAEAPRLPETIKLLPKPNLTEDERTALHNVTSALCNRKQVKDVIDEAVVGTCMALRVPMPEKKGKGKGKKTGNSREDQEEQADDVQKKPAATKEEKPAQKSSKQAAEAEDAEDSNESWEGFGSDAEAKDDPADSDAEEKAFSRFDDMLGGSSDEDDGGRSDDDDEDSRARSIRGPSDYFSGSSAEEDSEADVEDDDEEEDSEDEAEGSDSSAAISPPPKKVKSRAAKPVLTASGNSQFLPSLMGGYISGSESEASDLDIAPPTKKNRRGQRARQAIWEKKFKKEANHVKRQAEMDSRDEGWDMKKGAVGEDSGPWKKGISNPFEKKSAPEGVHPDRQANFNARSEQQERRAPPKPQQQDRGFKGGRGDRPAGNFRGERAPSNFQRDQPPRAAPKPKPKKDDEGPLHASWQAAKLAKEAAQNVKFEGKKITFD
ncbi:hypothetical protein E8E14_001037 [Neopestalotiopsis sp. 37M]|nr:hypothetical protein E8E14_001037 [Neopestalotiopsis sp. 37M]